MLGICVVHLPSATHGDRLFLHALDRIARHTVGPHRVLAVALRCTDEQRARLLDRGVELVEPTGAARGPFRLPREEHAALLTQLVDRAVAEGHDPIVTLDPDAWPVLDGWDVEYAARLDEATPVAAVLRLEVRSNFPHPCFTMLRAGSWRPGTSTFAPWEPTVASLAGQPGAGLLDQLHAEGRGLLRLERSNAFDEHPILFGLYDDAVFHLGAGSRFVRFDGYRRPPALPLLDRIPRLARWRRRRWRDRSDRREAAQHARFVARLWEDEEAVLTALAGGPLTPFEPLPTRPPDLPSRTPRGRRTPLVRRVGAPVDARD